MSKFWLNFMKEKKDLLLEGDLRAYDMHLNYTWAESVKGNESIAVVYAEDKIIKPETKETAYIVNGTTSGRIVCELTGSYDIEIYDCCGEKVGQQAVRNAEGEIVSVNIPVGGLAVLK